ncbi:TetR/AcrR family transcriptional regulator [Litorivivens sp.]|uniref:TetR/AcrR family transcriptional regulator n=1 Tax=Litorivivens sp. TaxID=2020868 RepID=UPI0035694055
MARRRDKAATREAILEAARTVLSSDGPDALSLTKVANLAGINRGTAYQHFETREELIKATVEWVSNHLSTTIFGEVGVDESGHWEGGASDRPLYEVVEGLVDFAVDNPALCRIWLFEVLAADNPGEDRFFRQFKESTREMAESEIAQEGIDPEALSVLMLAGYFLWPVWVDSHAKTKKERENMKTRMRREVLRLCLFGVVKTDSNQHILDNVREREKARTGKAWD